MATKPDLTKDQKIKKEIARLSKLYRDLDGNKRKAVQSLIENAAFMSVSLEELQEIINAEGYTQEYQNGANQCGVKQHEAVKIHIAMTRNHTTILKTLADLTPPEPRKQSKLDMLRGDDP